MKISILVTFLIFNCICSFGQIEWEVIPAHNYDVIQSRSDYMHGYHFAAMNDERIFINREKNNKGPYVYQPKDSTFQKITYKKALYGRKDALFMPNGNLVFAADKFISKDGGLNWIPLDYELLDQDRGTSRNHRSIHFKNDVLYWLSNKAIHISTTYGESIEGWNWMREKSKIRNGQDSLKVIGRRGDERCVSSDGFVYHLNYEGRDLNLRVTNLKGHQKGFYSISKLFNYPLDIETSYNGNLIYIASYDQENEARIFKSKGDPSVFEEMRISEMTGIKDINIVVDRFENVYLLTENQVWMSKNEGVTWSDITPTNPNFLRPIELELGYNNHLYLSSDGIPFLKSKQKLNE